MKLKKHGKVLVTVKSQDKRKVLPEIRQLASLGYEIYATGGTHKALIANGIESTRVNKVHEGRPHIVDMIKNRELDLVLNTPSGRQQRIDDSQIRAEAVSGHIPVITTVSGISAVVSALSALHRGELDVTSIQEHHKLVQRPALAKR
jgi:carbamoyl-phosphate synthase large subunit